MASHSLEARKDDPKLAHRGAVLRRAAERMQTMVQELRDGLIGKVFLAQCFYARRRAPIGFGKVTPPPAELDCICTIRVV